MVVNSNSVTVIYILRDISFNGRQITLTLYHLKCEPMMAEDFELNYQIIEMQAW